MSCVPMNYGTLSLREQITWIMVITVVADNYYGYWMNTCIFLVRYYSGQKLGPYRFKVFNEVALEALNSKNG